MQFFTLTVAIAWLGTGHLQNNVVDLCFSLRFFHPEPMVVMFVTQRQVTIALPESFAQHIRLIQVQGDHIVKDGAQIDFLLLDQLPRPQRLRWLKKAETHHIPVASVFHQSPIQAFLAWNGTGKKRFQTYVNRDLMESHHLRAKLPAITTVHLLRHVAENPICTTPNHVGCLPWNP